MQRSGKLSPDAQVLLSFGSDLPHSPATMRPRSPSSRTTTPIRSWRCMRQPVLPRSLLYDDVGNLRHLVAIAFAPPGS